MLAAIALLNCIAFIVTKRHFFLYLDVAFTISVGTYLGFHRTQIRKKVNIKYSDSPLDDCVFHLVCPCCSLSQETRTLEMNNVQDGTWHGRGDTICVGGYGEGSKSFVELHPPPIISTKSDPAIVRICGDHSLTSEVGHSAPLVTQPQ
jgi:Cys-rich protein (TIGR01571 family)